ncbi:MAG: hypothetical protein K0S09_2687 [Sphingobacteriaceae bacterium]|jgi:hypothetical protein|nr:hypothetical protein [Sphingobacteriaceae bacterium]
MKKLTLILALFCFSASIAQTTNQCGILVPPSSLKSSFLDVYEAKRVVETVLDSINWKQNFYLQEQNGINNAYATVIRGQRFIIYDNNFLSNLDEFAGTRWASISVLAHEMGHHYFNHVLDRGGSTPERELEADYFSGYVMAKLGSSLNQATVAIQKISSPQASSTHPGKADRVTAIQRGWNYARGLNTPSNSGVRNPAPQPQKNPPPTANETGWITLSQYGNTDMIVYLSDDGRTYAPARIKTTQPFTFRYEIYNYGWMRFVDDPRALTYKLMHGKNYSIIWNQRTNNWTVVQVK